MNDMTRLGMFDTPSRKWWVSYNGGISLGVGVYEFIFRGDESLTGAVVQLTGAGLNASWGIKKGGKARGGGTGKQPLPNGGAKKQDGDLLDVGQDAVNYKDAVDDHVGLRDNAAPWCDMKQASLVTAKRPFSLYELNQSWGGIQGMVEAGAVFVVGAVLKLNASMSVVSAYDQADPNTLFEGWTVYNTDDGSIGVGIGFLQGKWSVVRNADLFTSRCPIKSGPGLERFYSSDPKLQDLPD